MSSSRDVHLVGRDDPRRPTFLELFFDLIYVFVFAEMVSRVVRRLELTRVMPWPDGLLNEAGKLLLLLVAVWFVWWQTAWTTSRYDPKRAPIQLVVIVAVFGSLVLGLALPRAWRLYGLVFVIAYVGTHMARAVILAVVLRGERRQLKLRMLIYYCVAAIPWFAGTLLEQWHRGIVWLAALSIEFFGTKFGWPVPGFKRTSEEASVIAGEHLGERYQQIFLIALGESILGSGLALSQIGFKAGPTAAFAVSAITTVLLWRIYFQRAGLILAEAIARARRPHKIGQSVAATHFVMIAGVVITSTGYQLALALPFSRTADWIIIVIGPALFLAGRARLEYEVFGRVARSRLVALAVLAAISPAMFRAPQLVPATAVAAVLAGVAIVDTVRARRHPAEEPSPARL
jgi:low temperature requirement protein LtrA